MNYKEISRQIETKGKPEYTEGARQMRALAQSLLDQGLLPKYMEGEPGDTIFAIQEYKHETLTPDLINKTWQHLWKEWGKRINHKFEVPACDRTSEELAQLKKEKKIALLLPDEIYGKEGLILLQNIFPQMKISFSSTHIDYSKKEEDKELVITNEDEKGGCIDVEANIQSPNIELTEQKLKELFSKKGRMGQRFATYMVASFFSKLLTERYFETPISLSYTSSRLLGSRVNGNTIEANTFTDGGIWLLLDPYPDKCIPSLGGRSEGRKKPSAVTI